MARDFSLSDQVRIESPCAAPWSSMQGDRKRRHCSACGLDVHNISAMRQVDADALLRSSGGRLCVNYWRDSGGRVLTKEHHAARAAAMVRHCIWRVQGTAIKWLIAAGLTSLSAALTACSTSLGGQVQPARLGGSVEPIDAGRAAPTPVDDTPPQSPVPQERK